VVENFGSDRHLLCKLHKIWSVDSQENQWNCCHQMLDFKAEMHQIRFWLGLRPRPRCGSLQHSPEPLAGFNGSYFYEERREREGRARRAPRTQAYPHFISWRRLWLVGEVPCIHCNVYLLNNISTSLCVCGSGSQAFVREVFESVSRVRRGTVHWVQCQTTRFMHWRSIDIKHRHESAKT